MYKTCNVVIFTTEEEANVGDFIISQYVKDRTLHCGIKVWESEIEEINQHIYITSDEEIKEGDWFYYEAEKTIMQCTEHNFYFTPELIQNYSNVYKIIVTTDTSLKLPNIPQQFIKQYIEEYNKGNVITKVMVEYNSGLLFNNLLGYKLNVNNDNTINIKPIKDSWNREEVSNLLINAIGDAVRNDRQSNHISIAEFVINWIEENV